MRFARLLSLFAFLTGFVALTAALACGGGEKSQSPTVAATASPTETATATATSTRTPTPTSTATPTPTPFDGKVARMVIPRFGVDAPIEELGLTADNVMETPRRENTDVGWYHIWTKPGWAGNAVFSAHIYYHNVPAPFRRLQEAKAGDEVNVVMEDGTQYHYKVVSNKNYHRDTIPMGDIIWPPNLPSDKQLITLISCGGSLDASGQEYIDRVVVVAERVS